MARNYAQRKGDQPHIIITPPLTGCSTLASMIAVPDRLILDCDRVPGFTTRGKPLRERKAIFRDIARFSGASLVCLPVLPADEDIALVCAIVIIPPSLFIRRLMAIPDSRYADGHRIAALQWRDEAVRLAASSQMTPYTSLTQVPAIASLSIGDPDASHSHDEVRLYGQYK